MTRVDMEAVERMLNEATPGPWVVDDDDLSTIWGGGGRVVVCEGTIDSVVDGSTCDRDLIAAAPTLIRALIEEVRGLREAMPTDEERIAIGNRPRHDYDRRYPGDALVDHVKAIDWLARIEAARSR